MADVVVDNDNTNPMELLRQGVRAYNLRDYTGAVSVLSKASELLVAKHGDAKHDSLADVYLHYGKALLELNRKYTDAFGGFGAYYRDIHTKTEKNGEEQAGDDVKTSETAEVESSDKIEVLTDGVVETNGTAKEDPSGPASAKIEKKLKRNRDLEVAWGVLQDAKKIFEKRGEAAKKSIAETLLNLGEIAIENEKVELSVDLINQSLRMRRQLYPEDSRALSETHLYLGIAYTDNDQYDKGLENFVASSQYLENKAVSLNQDIQDLWGCLRYIHEQVRYVKWHVAAKNLSPIQDVSKNVKN